MDAEEPVTGGQSMPSTVTAGRAPRACRTRCRSPAARRPPAPRRRHRELPGRRRCAPAQALGVVQARDRGVALLVAQGRQHRSISAASASSGAAPPNMPEWSSDAIASTVTTTLTMPRRVTVAAAVPPRPQSPCAAWSTSWSPSTRLPRSSTPACSAAPPPMRSPRSSRCSRSLRDARGQHHDHRPRQHPAAGPGRHLSARTSSAPTPGVARRVRRCSATAPCPTCSGRGRAVTDARHRLPAGRRAPRPSIVPRTAARLNLRVPPGMAARRRRPHRAGRRTCGPQHRGASTSTVRPGGHRFPVRGGRTAARRIASHEPLRCWRPTEGPMTTLGPGRVDPPLQRVRRHLPGRGDHPDGGRGTARAHPRAERER